MNSKQGRRCLLIADDLTGACDSGVQFARHGISSTTLLDPAETVIPESEALCIATDSRGDDDATAIHKVKQAAERLQPYKSSDSLLFKKIDSCFRGNVVVETEGMLDFYRCKIALVAPAFPAMKRVVKKGILDTGDEASPAISLPVAFDRKSDSPFLELHNVSSLGGPEKIRQIIAKAIEEDITFLLADSTTDQDLYDLAQAAESFQQDLLWVGSGGLAQAAARTLKPRKEKSSSPQEAFQSSLVCLIGSNHPVTDRQIEHFVSHTNVELASFESLSFPEIRRSVKQALEQGKPLLIRIDRDHTTEASIRMLWKVLGPDRIGGLFLCGGDTGMKVCMALGSTAITLKGEISTGIPWGILSNGLAEGIPVITKSGGFGDPTCLSDIVAQFEKPKKAAYGH